MLLSLRAVHGALTCAVLIALLALGPQPVVEAAGGGAAAPGGATALHAAATPRAGAAACGVATGVKPLIRGLVDRQQVPPAAGLQGAVIQVNWSDLEPSDGVFDNSKIDAALVLAGCSTPLKLRILAGVHAPLWLKTMNGAHPEVAVYEPYTMTSGTIGQFWTPDFESRYDGLQAELAAAYDSVPNLDEVIVSSCTVFYAEPLIRYASVSGNVSALRGAGYTEALDQQCQKTEIDSVNQRWKFTRFSVAFNPYQVIPASGPTTIDEAYTEQLMGYCRFVGGARCVLENDSIRDHITTLLPQPQYSQMYDRMSGASGPLTVTINGLGNPTVTLGPPLAFQTATAVPNNIVDLWATLIWARQRRAASVELPADGQCTVICAPGPLPWQNLAEVALWFEGYPSISPTPLSAVEGARTDGATVATATFDELAAMDTVGGYGDVGAVPFDAVSASVSWADGATEAGRLSAGGQPGASTTCPSTRWCTVTIASGGHAPAEEGAGALSVRVTRPVSGWPYLPADGIQPVVAPAATVADALLSVTNFTDQVGTAGKVTVNAVILDADPLGAASDYSASVSWGDGSSTIVAVTPGAGAFQVASTHTYGGPAAVTVSVSVTDGGGASASGSLDVSPFLRSSVSGSGASTPGSRGSSQSAAGSPGGRGPHSAPVSPADAAVAVTGPPPLDPRLAAWILSDLVRIR